MVNFYYPQYKHKSTQYPYLQLNGHCIAAYFLHQLSTVIRRRVIHYESNLAICEWVKCNRVNPPRLLVCIKFDTCSINLTLTDHGPLSFQGWWRAKSRLWRWPADDKPRSRRYTVLMSKIIVNFFMADWELVEICYHWRYVFVSLMLKLYLQHWKTANGSD